MGYLQPSIKGSDSFKDVSIQFENPFDTPKGCRLKYSLGDNTNDELSEFYGSLNSDELY